MRKRTSIYRQPPSAWSREDELLSYFNFGVVANAEADHHPWRIMLRETRPEDFVVVKVRSHLSPFAACVPRDATGPHDGRWTLTIHRRRSR